MNSFRLEANFFFRSGTENIDKLKGVFIFKSKNNNFQEKIN